MRKGFLPTQVSMGRPLAGLMVMVLVSGMVILLRAIFVIRCPSGGVFEDVAGNAVVFGLVADDVFVVVTLPDSRSGGAADQIQAVGDRGFIGPEDGGDGTRDGFAELFEGGRIGWGTAG